MSDDQGPYPKGDRKELLQRKSLKALQQILPEEQFLFRDERIDDKGVDGALELVIDETFRNCRAQVQLKSTDDGPGKFNADGSYSLSVDTSNLNYLLNGPCPLYVIWFSTTNEIRYAWAHDEWQRLDAADQDWMSKGSFTIRFSRVLNAAALREIRDRILDTSRMHRRIHESVARSAPADRVVIGIDPKTLATTNPTELYDRLLNGGMTLVSSGYGKQVLDWFSLLNPDAANEPRIQLVAAFAASSIGRYHEAKAHLASAVLKSDALSEDDRQFLEYLSGACDYYMGRIDRPTYLKREAEWANRLTGIRAAEHQLEVLRHERLTERNYARRGDLLKRMRGLVTEIETNQDASPPQKIQAQLIFLSAEGDDLVTQFIEDAARIGMRENMGYSASSMAAETGTRSNERWAAWEKRATRLREAAVEVGHPLLIADAISARISVYVQFLLMQRMNAIGQGVDQKPAKPIVEALIEDAKQAIEVYRLAGSLSGEFQVKMFLADLHNVCGDEKAAKELAQSILPAARAMNYERLQSQATEHLEGRTVLQQFVVRVAERPTDDEIALAQSDDAVRDMARMTLESLRIPLERLTLVEKDCFAGRFIAQERQDWCRHIELLQDLRHLEHSETAYQTDPERICTCKKLGYKSGIGLTDYQAVVAVFKNAYCDGCPHRDPNHSTDKR